MAKKDLTFAEVLKIVKRREGKEYFSLAEAYSKGVIYQKNLTIFRGTACKIFNFTSWSTLMKEYDIFNKENPIS